MSKSIDNGLKGDFSIQTNAMTMQINNNNNTGCSNPTVNVTYPSNPHQSDDAHCSNPTVNVTYPSNPHQSDDAQGRNSIQRQDSFEKDNHLDTNCLSKESTKSLEDRRRIYSVGSSGRGSGSAEISQDESMVDSMESGYGGNRRRSSTFNDRDIKPKAIAEEGCIEEVMRTESVKKEGLKGTKRNREFDSFEIQSKIKRVYIDNPEIEQCHKELDEQINSLCNKKERFTNESLKHLDDTVQSLSRLGSSVFKKATQDCDVATKQSETEERVYKNESDSRCQPDIKQVTDRETSFELPQDLTSFKLPEDLMEQVTDQKPSFELEMRCKRNDCASLSVQTANICGSTVDSLMSPSIQREESVELPDYLDAPVQTGEYGGLAILETFDPIRQLEILQLNCRCQVQSCCRLSCRRVREVVLHIKICSVNSMNYLPCLSCQQVITFLYYHSNICEELKCPVPFCTFFRQHSGLSIDHCRAKLYNHFAKKVLIMTLMELGWLREDHKYDWVAEEYKDFWMKRQKNRLYLLNTFLEDPSGYGMFNTVQMCIDVPRHTDRYAVKKCCISQDNRQEILDVMSKVNENCFPQIAAHLWCRLSDNSAYICTKLVQGGSLKRLINSRSEQDLRTLEENRLSYFDQACMVAVHLRDLRIVLLDWSSDHISLDETRQRMIFHDFSNALILDATKRYTSRNKKKLKPHLTPIEVCRKRTITCQSDVWGVGTLLYELFHRKTTFFNMSHEHPEVVRNKIGCGYKPETSWCNNSALTNLLKNCWLDDPNERIFIQDARTHRIFSYNKRERAYQCKSVISKF